MIKAGMNVARINFSHGGREWHARVYETMRNLSDKVAIMQDLQGPKIRIGKVRGGDMTLIKGEEVLLTTDDVPGTRDRISVNYQNLPKDVIKGDPIFLADGTIHLEVEGKKGNNVLCRIVNGGVLTSGKGVNLPGVKLSAEAMTPKDKEDLAFGLGLGVDFVALSFVRRPEEVAELKKMVVEAGSSARVIAKIEKKEAIDSFDAILKEADGIMIARGDLGVEIPPEKVPAVQKKLIKRCLDMGKPVITATQMLVSMTDNERPTRAEASDVANAVLDGSDALMLSEETATGKHPVESVEMMKKIIEETERESVYGHCLLKDAEDVLFDEEGALTDAVCLGAAEMAEKIGASAIGVLSHTGKTARMIARRRPSIPIIVLTDSPDAARSTALLWGAVSLLVDRIETTEKIFAISRERLKESGYKGKVVLTAGIPTRERTPTNTAQVLYL